jgi:hypothetical protein
MHSYFLVTSVNLQINFRSIQIVLNKISISSLVNVK